MSSHSSSNADAAGLRAGAAQADITPPMGTQIAGAISSRRPVQSVMDPLFAKALVLQLGERKVCLVSMDLLAITRQWVEEIRRHAAHLGFGPDAVIVHVTQNHAAPAFGHFMVTDECGLVPPEHDWLRGGDRNYNPIALEGAVQAIEAADAALEPVAMAFGAGIDGRVAFNRRFVMRDGRGEMFGGGDRENILYREGPADPEVGLVLLRACDGRNVAALLHHTCHPTHSFGGNTITAGWPGEWCSHMREHLGDTCVPLVINGCCGNVHHRDVLDPNFTESAERVGRLLAESTSRLLPDLQFGPVDALDLRTSHIDIPLRQVDPEDLAAARQSISEHPDPIWIGDGQAKVHTDWFYALSRIDLAGLVARRPVFDYEIQVLRIGDLAVAALIGEPFVEGQLDIKLRSPARRTFVAHMCNAYVGYLPTKEALARGGYETKTAHWSKLCPDALETVVDATVEMLAAAF